MVPSINREKVLLFLYLENRLVINTMANPQTNENCPNIIDDLLIHLCIENLQKNISTTDQINAHITNK